MIEFSPEVFFNTRELDICPPHFIKATTPAHNEALVWVKNKLRGRYSLVIGTDNDLGNFIFSQTLNIFFEDPSEATMYELRWSGTK